METQGGTGVLGGERGGISRRDLIKGSVVAGGLVWAAPVLVSSPAAASHLCACNNGIQTTIKLPSNPTSSVNCGVQCISAHEGINFPCLTCLVDCLIEKKHIEFADEDFDFEHGRRRRTRIRLKSGITLLAVAIKSSDECWFATCPNFCPNTCERQSSQPGQPPTPCISNPVPDRIHVCPTGASGGTCPGGDTRCADPVAGETEILIDTLGEPINPAELSLCIPNALTGLCPAC